MFEAPATQDARGTTVLHATPEDYLNLAAAAKAGGFDFFVDLCGVDYLGDSTRANLPITAERFEVVLILFSHKEKSRLQIRVQVPEGSPSMPSVFDLFPGSENPEREAFDMFGISFDGHPDLVRILMPEEWEGHPLRKDFSVGAVPVQFKGTK